MALIRLLVLLTWGLLPAFVGAGFPVVVAAGEFNRVLSIGDSAPMWSGLLSVAEKSVDLADFEDKAVVVIVFTCNSCPYAVDAEERLNELQAWLTMRSGQLIAINVNNITEDSLPEMRKRAAAKEFKFPYLHDPSQQIARDYGATTTPEFFVLDRERKIAYMGALDDSPDGSTVTKSFVRNAVAGLIGGEISAVSETVPIGCRIRFDRIKRTRK